MDMVSQLEAMVQEQYHGEDGTEELTSTLVRAGFRRLLEEMLEAEVSEYLGREPYERSLEALMGYRNGYKERRIDTAEGRVPVRVPQVRDTEDPYRSRLWQAMRKRTEILE